MNGTCNFTSKASRFECPDSSNSTGGCYMTATTSSLNSITVSTTTSSINSITASTPTTSLLNSITVSTTTSSINSITASTSITSSFITASPSNLPITTEKNSSLRISIEVITSNLQTILTDNTCKLLAKMVSTYKAYILLL